MVLADLSCCLLCGPLGGQLALTCIQHSLPEAYGCWSDLYQLIRTNVPTDITNRRGGGDTAGVQHNMPDGQAMSIETRPQLWYCSSSSSSSLRGHH